MNLALALLSLIAGYAFGSISFTRLFARRLFPNEDISTTAFKLSGTENATFVISSVSASAIFARAGRKSGSLVAVLDILKAVIPVLAFKTIFPTIPSYHLIAAIGVLLGHNYPVQHGFRGGRGLSVLFGSMLVIDWPAGFILLGLGIIIGIGLFRDAFVMYMLSVFLGIPWFWFRFGDWPHIVTAILLNLIFFVSVLPEFKQYIQLRQSGAYQKSLAHRAANRKESSLGKKLRKMFGHTQPER